MNFNEIAINFTIYMFIWFIFSIPRKKARECQIQPFHSTPYYIRNNSLNHDEFLKPFLSLKLHLVRARVHLTFILKGEKNTDPP